jgi:hypothetical protein
VNLSRDQSRLFSFIVRIWIDDASGEYRGSAGWHGQITHVPSGKNRYVKKLDEITGFISGYLNETQKLTLRARVSCWLKQLL